MKNEDTTDLNGGTVAQSTDAATSPTNPAEIFLDKVDESIKHQVDTLDSIEFVESESPSLTLDNLRDGLDQCLAPPNDLKIVLSPAIYDSAKEQGVLPDCAVRALVEDLTEADLAELNEFIEEALKENIEDQIWEELCRLGSEGAQPETILLSGLACVELVQEGILTIPEHITDPHRLYGVIAKEDLSIDGLGYKIVCSGGES